MAADFAVTNTFVNGNLTDATTVNENFTDVEDQFNQYCWFKLGAGTLTIPNTADTEGEAITADLNITAGMLTATGIIKVYATCDNSLQTTRTLKLQVRIENAAATGSVVAADFANNRKGDGIIGVIMQSPNATDEVFGMTYNASSGGTGSGASLDTGDANIFTTAFTIRFKAWFDGGPPAAGGYIRYYAEAIKQ